MSDDEKKAPASAGVGPESPRSQEARPLTVAPEIRPSPGGESTSAGTAPPLPGWPEAAEGRHSAAPVPAAEPSLAAPAPEGAALIGSAVLQPRRPEFVAAYEHSAVVRFCHWLNAVALLVMMTSGWRIFIAFPSFGPKIPEHKLVNIPGAITLGGWLGGALQWHYTFMWVFTATGMIYVGYLIASGEYKMMLFRPRDVPGVWPMARHYFLFGPEPKQTEPYNALQKLAYTTIVLCGALSVVTGIVILRPVQLSGLAWLMGGFHLARVWHFVAMCGFVAFIPGHLVMVALHGWNNFMSMVRGWKKNPEYL